MNHLKKYWKVYCWGILITVLSCLPADNKGPEWLNFQHTDKILHFLFYGIFTALIILALPKKPVKNISLNKIILAVLLILVYGSLIETVQHYFITSRTGDPVDVIFNISGGIFAAAIVFLLTRFMARKNRH